MRKNADAMDSYEYLGIYLWDKTRQREAEDGFIMLKPFVPAFTPFGTFEQLLKRINQNQKDEARSEYNESNDFSDDVFYQLIEVYQGHLELHPQIILIFLMILWQDMEELYDNYKRKLARHTEPFSEIYWFYLEEIGCWDLNLVVTEIRNTLREIVHNRIDPPRKKKCKEFEVAITEYATGHYEDIEDKKALWIHLRVCKRCRKKLFQTQETVRLLGSKKGGA